MSNVATPGPDPAHVLEATYRRVAETRMHGLPFVNPALAVEAVGFAPWERRWLGVLVTPWCINLVLAPLDPSAWRPLGQGEKRCYRFPAGDYEFIGTIEPGIGELQLCSLFSPVLEFEDQATARFVAAHARAALLDAANGDAPMVDGPRPGRVVPVRKSMDAPMSRRDVLRGRFLPDIDADRR